MRSDTHIIYPRSNTFRPLISDNLFHALLVAQLRIRRISDPRPRTKGEFERFNEAVHVEGVGEAACLGYSERVQDIEEADEDAAAATVSCAAIYALKAEGGR